MDDLSPLLILAKFIIEHLAEELSDYIEDNLHKYISKKRSELWRRFIMWAYRKYCLPEKTKVIRQPYPLNGKPSTVSFH